MLKFCLMILSLLFLTDIPYANNTEFDESISKSYKEYAEYYNYDNGSFCLKIIQGEVNGKYTYGICFSNEYAKTYNIELVSSENKKYVLPQDRRGDISVIALEKISDTYTINVYKDGEKINLLTKPILSPFDEDDFKNIEMTKISFGENKGATITKLNKKGSEVDSFTFVLVGIGLITFGCLIIIFVYAKTKKGMFNKENRSKDVFNFKEFLSQEFDEKPNNEFEVIDISPEKDEDEISVYEHSLRYDDEASGFPLEEHLRDKGFVTDYKLASEEEKQQIMLELMKLKNDKTITEDEYLEEAYKLWKE